MDQISALHIDITHLACTSWINARMLSVHDGLRLGPRQAEVVAPLQKHSWIYSCNVPHSYKVDCKQPPAAAMGGWETTCPRAVPAGRANGHTPKGRSAASVYLRRREGAPLRQRHRVHVHGPRRRDWQRSEQRRHVRRGRGQHAAARHASGSVLEHGRGSPARARAAPLPLPTPIPP